MPDHSRLASALVLTDEPNREQSINRLLIINRSTLALNKQKKIIKIN